jgi:glycosidase
VQTFALKAEIKRIEGINVVFWKMRKRVAVLLSVAMVLQILVSSLMTTASYAASPSATTVGTDNRITFAVPKSSIDLRVAGGFSNNDWGDGISVTGSVYTNENNEKFVKLTGQEANKNIEYKYHVKDQWMSGSNLVATSDANGILLLPLPSFQYIVLGSFDNNWANKIAMTDDGTLLSYTTGVMDEGTYEYKLIVSSTVTGDLYLTDPTNPLLSSGGNSKIVVGPPGSVVLPDVITEQPGSKSKWVIAGSFQQAQGDSNNWDPTGAATKMKHVVGDYYAYSTVLDAGSYEFKFTRNGGWDNGITDGGNNIKFTLAATTKVNFYLNEEKMQARTNITGMSGIPQYVPVLEDVSWPRLVGSVQTQFGEEAWKPEQAKQLFVDYYFDNTVYKLQRNISEGTHEAKVVMGADWDQENFGENGGNSKFTLLEDTDVTFSFDNTATTKVLKADYTIGDGTYDGNIQASEILFNSRSETYKKPFGAIKQGLEDVTLRIAAKRNDVQVARVELTNGSGSATSFDMRKVTSIGEKDYFEAVIPKTTFNEIGIWGYKFILIDGGKKLEYGEDDLSGGSGIAVDDGAIPFNLTVYDAEYRTPDWMKNAVVYQIFPDRFFDGNENNNRAKLVDGYRGVLSETGPNAGMSTTQPLQYFDGGLTNDPAANQVWGEWSDVPERPDRSTPENKPYYPNAKTDGVWTNEFYGGDIQGIEAKLDYLQSVGATAIYLNPVAWAASNHKYDATDYKHLDPMFGQPVYNTPGDANSGLDYEETRKQSDKVFMDFAREAAERGIRIINDGVFNHVGDDSIYFDRYEKYPEIGAYEYWAKVWRTKAKHAGMTKDEAETEVRASFTSQINPATGTNYQYPQDFGFTTWFTIGENTVLDKDSTNTHFNYDAWWGYDSLPAMDAKEPQPGDTEAIAGGAHEWNNVDYRNEVIGYDLSGESANGADAAMQDSASQRWIWMGSNGWRLDVAPDVSSDTWKKFRTAVKSTTGLTNGNGTIIEDPVILGEEWGVATRYLLGDQFDSVMNYRFRGALQDFIIGGEAGTSPNLASNLNEALERIREDYPKEAWQVMLNLVDSHDTVRSITKLDEPTWEEENKKIAADATDEALKQQALIAIFQMGYPGAPTIYYGDEVGMTGTKDPDSRRSFPWERVAQTGDQFSAKGRYGDLLNTYQTAAEVRNNNAVFSTGDIHLAYAQGTTIAYARKNATDAGLVAINSGKEENVFEANVAGFLPDGLVFADQLGSDITATVTNGKLSITLPALSGVMMLADGTLNIVETPANLSATASNGSVALVWVSVAGAQSYGVYRAPIDGGAVEKLGTSNTASFSDTNVINGTKYYYAVSAVTGTSESLLTEMVSATPSFPIQSLSVPTALGSITIGFGIATDEITADVSVLGLTNDSELAGVAATNLMMQLAYYKDGESSHPNFLSMKYKADNGSAKTYKAKFEPTEPGTYHYYVKASTDNGETYTTSAESSFTALADSLDTVAPSAPALQAILVESGRAVLTWTAADNSTKGYDVYRSVAGGDYRKIAALRNALSFTDFTVTNGTDYAYKVASFDASYNRSYSAVQTVTPQLVMVDVTMRLHLPDYTPVTDQIYIAGDFNGWNSSGGKLNVPSGATNRSVVEYTFKMMAGRAIQYKYTRGTWDTEAFTSHTRQENDETDYGNWAYSSTDTNMRLTVSNQGGNQMLIDDYILRWVDMPMNISMPRISYGDDIVYSTSDNKFTLKATVPYGVHFTMNGTPLPEGAMNHKGEVYLENIPLQTGLNEFELHIEPTQETKDLPWYSDDGRVSQATRTIHMSITRTSSGNNGDVPSVPTVPTPKPKPDNDGIALGDGALQQKAGKTDDGRPLITYSVDEVALKNAFAKLKDNQAQKININLGATTGSVDIELPVAAFGNMAQLNPKAILSFSTDQTSYDLPLSVLHFEQLASSLGTTAELMKLRISLEPVTGEAASQLIKSAEREGLTVIGTPIKFTVTVEGNGKKQELNDFGSTYVSRTITLTAVVSGGNVSAVLYDPTTGEMTFVPALFEVLNGKTVVTIKRNGNSIYTIVENHKSFADVTANHWAKADIELLASKLVIKGTSDTTFNPNGSITRAEFASLLVRALGLNADKEAAKFSDVQQTQWYAGAVGAAVKAGIVKGFADGTFKPQATITREQMGVMIQNALQFIGKAKQLSADEQATKLANFKDGTEINGYAKAAVAALVDAGILKGISVNTFAPDVTVDRAQSAVILTRLLQYVEFID